MKRDVPKKFNWKIIQIYILQRLEKLLTLRQKEQIEL